MTFIVLVVSLLSGCLLDALVGLVGSRRNIGFGWSFFLSLVLTPLVGLIITLLSDPLPDGGKRWGCLIPTILTIIFIAIVLIVAVSVFGVVLTL